MIGKTNAKNYYIYKLIEEVPKEFQVVEYLESDGLSYIDTEVLSHSNMCAELQFEFTEIPNDGGIIGTKYSGKNRERLYFYHYFQGPKLGYGNYFGSEFNTQIGETYHVKTRLDVGNQYMYINENLIYQGQNTTYINTRLNFYIFNLNTAGKEDGKYFTKAKLYFCKIWDNDDLIRYFIPVYRIEDNIPGLYDIINQKFYINQGTGNFLLGENSEFNLELFNSSKI